MSKSINEAHILGRVGRDAELRYTGSGKAVAKFSLATGGGKKKDGNGEWPTDWHSIVVWGELAEAAGRFIRKGAEVELVGRISYSKWEKDGVKHERTEIVANKLSVNREDLAAPDRHVSDEQIARPRRDAMDDTYINDGDSIPF